MRPPRRAPLAAVAGAALPPWDPLLLSSGAYKYAVVDAADPTCDIVADGRATCCTTAKAPAAPVAVREAAGTTSLAIDGKVDASNAGDMLTQRLLAHVPLLLHPDAADGSPSSASAAASRSARR